VPNDFGVNTIVKVFKLNCVVSQYKPQTSVPHTSPTKRLPIKPTTPTPAKEDDSKLTEVEKYIGSLQPSLSSNAKAGPDVSLGAIKKQP